MACNYLHNHVLVKKHYRMTELKKIDTDEMYKSLAICLLSGSVKSSMVRDKFSNNSPFYHPIMPTTMSSRRFE